MLVLAVNAGSSSLKLALYQMNTQECLMEGQIDGIGKSHTKSYFNDMSVKLGRVITCKDHQEALDYLLKLFYSFQQKINVHQIQAIGYRVIHGQEKYHKSVVINDEVLQDIHKFQELAPLHTPAIMCCYTLLCKYFPNAIHCAVFDTAFHQSISPDLFLYGIPYSWYKQYHIRKYGAHGINHRFLFEKCKELDPQTRRIITCHLGNGSSICAIHDGVCMNTSIGFSTLSGIMMGTRCGDIDPIVIEYIVSHSNQSMHDVIHTLYDQSGLLGVSLCSNDMRVLLNQEEQGNSQAALAISMFIKQVIQTIGSYVMLLKGVDAIVFSGGIGENSVVIRKRICSYLTSVLDACLDEDANRGGIGDAYKISSDDSSCLFYVIKAQEELMIAKDTYDLCKNSQL